MFLGSRKTFYFLLLFLHTHVVVSNQSISEMVDHTVLSSTINPFQNFQPDYLNASLNTKRQTQSLLKVKQYGDSTNTTNIENNFFNSGHRFNSLMNGQYIHTRKPGENLTTSLVTKISDTKHIYTHLLNWERRKVRNITNDQKMHLPSITDKFFNPFKKLSTILFHDSNNHSYNEPDLTKQPIQQQHFLSLTNDKQIVLGITYFNQSNDYQSINITSDNYTSGNNGTQIKKNCNSIKSELQYLFLPCFKINQNQSNVSSSLNTSKFFFNNYTVNHNNMDMIFKDGMERFHNFSTTGKDRPMNKTYNNFLHNDHAKESLTEASIFLVLFVSAVTNDTRITVKSKMFTFNYTQFFTATNEMRDPLLKRQMIEIGKKYPSDSSSKTNIDQSTVVSHDDCDNKESTVLHDLAKAVPRQSSKTKTFEDDIFIRLYLPIDYKSVLKNKYSLTTLCLLKNNYTKVLLDQGIFNNLNEEHDQLNKKLSHGIIELNNVSIMGQQPNRGCEKDSFQVPTIVFQNNHTLKNRLVLSFFLNALFGFSNNSTVQTHNNVISNHFWYKNAGTHNLFVPRNGADESQNLFYSELNLFHHVFQYNTTKNSSIIYPGQNFSLLSSPLTISNFRCNLTKFNEAIDSLISLTLTNETTQNNVVTQYSTSLLVRIAHKVLSNNHICMSNQIPLIIDVPNDTETQNFFNRSGTGTTCVIPIFFSSLKLNLDSKLLSKLTLSSILLISHYTVALPIIIEGIYTNCLHHKSCNDCTSITFFNNRLNKTISTILPVSSHFSVKNLTFGCTNLISYREAEHLPNISQQNEPVLKHCKQVVIIDVFANLFLAYSISRHQSHFVANLRNISWVPNISEKNTQLHTMINSTFHEMINNSENVPEIKRVTEKLATDLKASYAKLLLHTNIYVEKTINEANQTFYFVFNNFNNTFSPIPLNANINQHVATIVPGKNNTVFIANITKMFVPRNSFDIAAVAPAKVTCSTANMNNGQLSLALFTQCELQTEKRNSSDGFLDSQTKKDGTCLSSNQTTENGLKESVISINVFDSFPKATFYGNKNMLKINLNGCFLPYSPKRLKQLHAFINSTSIIDYHYLIQLSRENGTTCRESAKITPWIEKNLYKLIITETNIQQFSNFCSVTEKIRKILSETDISHKKDGSVKDWGNPTSNKESNPTKLLFKHNGNPERCNEHFLVLDTTGFPKYNFVYDLDPIIATFTVFPKRIDSINMVPVLNFTNLTRVEDQQLFFFFQNNRSTQPLYDGELFLWGLNISECITEKKKENITIHLILPLLIQFSVRPNVLYQTTNFQSQKTSYINEPTNYQNMTMHTVHNFVITNATVYFLRQNRFLEPKLIKPNVSVQQPSSTGPTNKHEFNDSINLTPNTTDYCFDFTTTQNITSEQLGIIEVLFLIFRSFRYSSEINNTYNILSFYSLAITSKNKRLDSSLRHESTTSDFGFLKNESFLPHTIIELIPIVITSRETSVHLNLSSETFLPDPTFFPQIISFINHSTNVASNLSETPILTIQNSKHLIHVENELFDLGLSVSSPTVWKKITFSLSSTLTEDANKEFNLTVPTICTYNNISTCFKINNTRFNNSFSETSIISKDKFTRSVLPLDTFDGPLTIPNCTFAVVTFPANLKRASFFFIHEMDPVVLIPRDLKVIEYNIFLFDNLSLVSSDEINVICFTRFCIVSRNHSNLVNASFQPTTNSTYNRFSNTLQTNKHNDLCESIKEYLYKYILCTPSSTLGIILQQTPSQWTVFYLPSSDVNLTTNRTDSTLTFVRFENDLRKNSLTINKKLTDKNQLVNSPKTFMSRGSTFDTLLESHGVEEQQRKTHEVDKKLYFSKPLPAIIRTELPIGSLPPNLSGGSTNWTPIRNTTIQTDGVNIGHATSATDVVRNTALPSQINEEEELENRPNENDVKTFVLNFEKSESGINNRSIRNNPSLLNTSPKINTIKNFVSSTLNTPKTVLSTVAIDIFTSSLLTSKPSGSLQFGKENKPIITASKLKTANTHLATEFANTKMNITYNLVTPRNKNPTLNSFLNHSQPLLAPNALLDSVGDSLTYIVKTQKKSNKDKLNVSSESHLTRGTESLTNFLLPNNQTNISDTEGWKNESGSNSLVNSLQTLVPTHPDYNRASPMKNNKYLESNQLKDNHEVVFGEVYSTKPNEASLVMPTTSNFKEINGSHAIKHTMAIPSNLLPNVQTPVSTKTLYNSAFNFGTPTVSPLKEFDTGIANIFPIINFTKTETQLVTKNVSLIIKKTNNISSITRQINTLTFEQNSQIPRTFALDSVVPPYQGTPKARFQTSDKKRLNDFDESNFENKVSDLRTEFANMNIKPTRISPINLQRYNSSRSFINASYPLPLANFFNGPSWKRNATKSAEQQVSHPENSTSIPPTLFQEKLIHLPLDLRNPTLMGNGVSSRTGQFVKTIDNSSNTYKPDNFLRPLYSIISHNDTKYSIEEDGLRTRKSNSTIKSNEGVQLKSNLKPIRLPSSVYITQLPYTVAPKHPSISSDKPHTLLYAALNFEKLTDNEKYIVRTSSIRPFHSTHKENFVPIISEYNSVLNKSNKTAIVIKGSFSPTHSHITPPPLLSEPYNYNPVSQTQTASTYIKLSSKNQTSFTAELVSSFSTASLNSVVENLQQGVERHPVQAGSSFTNTSHDAHMFKSNISTKVADASQMKPEEKTFSSLKNSIEAGVLLPESKLSKWTSTVLPESKLSKWTSTVLPVMAHEMKFLQIIKTKTNESSLLSNLSEARPPYKKSGTQELPHPSLSTYSLSTVSVKDRLEINRFFHAAYNVTNNAKNVLNTDKQQVNVPILMPFETTSTTVPTTSSIKETEIPLLGICAGVTALTFTIGGLVYYGVYFIPGRSGPSTNSRSSVSLFHDDNEVNLISRDLFSHVPVDAFC